VGTEEGGRRKEEGGRRKEEGCGARRRHEKDKIRKDQKQREHKQRAHTETTHRIDESSRAFHVQKRAHAWQRCGLALL
jgi:hypothetical protein